ncbi:MAG TPA: glycosyltransferase family 2 protein [Candidatus Saccharimonadales bacterium]|nr:glycosyltransferase family 2 protein [Candidatus Saccharimonadales bacterium]
MTDERRLPISVCIIAGNEANRIRRALDSVAGWTSDLIVVINDDVNDGTDKIAGEFGAKVFREPWKGHVAQKNSATAKATCEWILGLDADESVTPELRAEIEKLFTGSEKPKVAAFSFPRCTIYCGRWIRHGDWYPDRQIRLWRRGAAKWGGIDPHDKLLVNGAVGKLKGDLKHFSMESMEQQFRKTITYANDFARHCAEQKKVVLLPALLFHPWWRFLRAYVLRMGFLDGWQGFAIARVIAIYTFLRYLRAYQAQKETETK